MMTYLLIFTMFATGDAMAQQPRPAEPDSAAIVAAENRMALTPDDDMARFRLGQTLGQAGRYDEALAEFNFLLGKHPENVDFVFGRAQVHYRQRNYEAAFTDLEMAKNLAPDYEAVWRLHYQVSARRQDAELDAVRNEARQRFPDANWWQVFSSQESSRWQLSIGAAQEALSDDLPDWSNQFVQLDWAPDDRHRFLGRLARDSRFGVEDQHSAIGASQAFRDIWSAGIELAMTQGADFLSDTGYSLHVGRRFSSGWNGTVRWQQRRYTTSSISIVSAAAERYFSRYRAAYSLNVSHLEGADNSLAHALAFDWYINDKHSLRLNFANGEEAECVGAGRILQTDVLSFTLSGRHTLTRRLTWSWWAGRHQQGSLYRRTYAGLAITIGL